MNGQSILTATATAAALLVPSGFVAYAGETWDGGGANDNWTTGQNWNAVNGFQFPPPNNGTANIHMAGTNGLTPLVNVAYSINSLTFDNTAGAFVILGAQELTIGAGGIVNNDTQIQSVIGPVKLAAHQAWKSTAGRLQMDVIDLNGFNLTFNGAFQIDLPNLIVGTGTVRLSDPFTSTVTMFGGGSNTYVGATHVNAGTLLLQKGGVAIPGHLWIGDVATVRLAANEQIASAPGVGVHLLTNGTFDVNTRTETLDVLEVGFDSTVITTGAGRVTAADAWVTGTWTNEGPLHVGDSFDAVLDIFGGGRVDNSTGYIGNQAGVIGTVTMMHDGTLWTNDTALIVGNFGQGTLDITNGADVTAGSSTYVGYQGSGVGFATVSGAGATLTSSLSTIVGSQGDGSLTISGGGVVSDQFGVLGSGPGSSGTVTVSGAGSTWNNSSDIWVGDGGHGLLELGNGAHVTNVNAFLADDGGSDGDVLVSGGSLWECSGDLYVGNQGDGSLDITTGGEVSSARSYIGNQGGSAGTATVDGTGSVWTTDADFYVGNESAGTLNITGGALVTAHGSTYIAYGRDSTSQASVDGFDSQWQIGNLYVGHSGHGSLAITNGGWVDTTLCIVGRNAGATGAVVVEGVDSRFTPDRPVIGNDGEGALTIANGARVVSSGFNSTVGAGSGGIGAVTIDGGQSEWFHHSDGAIMVDVANFGEGNLEITNGARFSIHNSHFGGDEDTTLRVAAQSGSNGMVTVDGVGSELRLSDQTNNDGSCVISIGAAGTGTLMVINGASVSNFGLTGMFGPGGIILAGGGGNGTLSLAGGSTVETVGFLSVGGVAGTGVVNITGGSLVTSATGSFGSTSGGHGTVLIDGPGSSWTMTGNCTLHDGDLTLSDAGLVQAASVIVNASSALHGNGSITATVQNNALVDPGLSIGTLEMTNYTQSAAGTLVVEVASATSNDQLLVASVATLDGTLTVNLIDGFVPSPGDTFTILAADDVDGTFATVNMPKGMQITYQAQAVILEVPAPICPADIAPPPNGNGVVNVQDLLAVISAWGACANPNDCPADIAPPGGNDIVNVQDLLAVISAWGLCP